MQWISSAISWDYQIFNYFFGLVFNDLLADNDEVQLKNKAEPSLKVLFSAEGFPLLPAIYFDTISPTSGHPLLSAYIFGMRGKYW